MDLLAFLLVFIGLVIYLGSRAKKKPIKAKTKPKIEIESMDNIDNDFSETSIQIGNIGFTGWNKIYSEIVTDDPNAPSFVKRGRLKYHGEKVGIITKKYYETFEKIKQARKSGNYKSMEEQSDLGLEMVEALVLDTKKCFGKFDLTAIPPIDDVLPIYAVQGMGEKLREIKALVTYIPELEAWLEQVTDAEEKVFLTEKIKETIKSNPGILQKDMKIKLQLDDGSEAANVIYYLESMGLIRKEKFKNTNKLFSIEQN